MGHNDAADVSGIRSSFGTKLTGWPKRTALLVVNNRPDVETSGYAHKDRLRGLMNVAPRRWGFACVARPEYPLGVGGSLAFTNIVRANLVFAPTHHNLTLWDDESELPRSFNYVHGVPGTFTFL